jgi:hypothetical protein
MSKKAKLILLAFIASAIPLTVLLSLQTHNYINHAANPDRKLVVGVSLSEEVSRN